MCLSLIVWLYNKFRCFKIQVSFGGIYQTKGARNRENNVATRDMLTLENDPAFRFPVSVKRKFFKVSLGLLTEMTCLWAGDPSFRGVWGFVELLMSITPGCCLLWTALCYKYLCPGPATFFFSLFLTSINDCGLFLSKYFLRLLTSLFLNKYYSYLGAGT